VLVALIVIISLAFDYTNGFHDAANAIATTVATKALKPKAALAMAAVGNLIGSFLSVGVAATVGKGVIDVAKNDHGLVVVIEKQKEKEKEKDTREIESFVPMKGMMKTLQVLNGKVKCNKIGVNCMCGNHVGYETSSGLNRITKYGQLRTYGKLLLPKNLPAYQLGIMATIEEQETEVVNSCNFIMLENTQLMITDKYSKFFMAEFFYNIANPSSYLINLKTYYLKEGKLHASTISTFVKCENMLLKKDFVHVIVFNSPSPVTLVNGVSDLPSMKGNIHTETAGKCYTLSWELDETYEMVNDGNEKYGYKIVFTEETRNEKIFSALCELIDMAQESERVKSRKSDDDVIPENILIGVSTISVEKTTLIILSWKI